LKATLDAGISQNTEMIEPASENPKESAGAEPPWDAEKLEPACDKPNEALDADAHQAMSQLFNHSGDGHGENQVEPRMVSLEKTSSTVPEIAAHTLDAAEVSQLTCQTVGWLRALTSWARILSSRLMNLCLRESAILRTMSTLKGTKIP
jgi:hypothetical protein